MRSLLLLAALLAPAASSFAQTSDSRIALMERAAWDALSSDPNNAQLHFGAATSAIAVRRMLHEAGGIAMANLIRDLGDGIAFDAAFAHRIQRSFDDFQAALHP